MRPHSKEPAKTMDGIWAAYNQLRKIFERNVSFGHPNHPEDAADTTLAGTAAVNHNGLLDNINGSWVEVEFTTSILGANCYHNLNQPLLVGPNVRWFVCKIEHDNAGTNPRAAPMCVYYLSGSVITENSIVLSISYTAAWRTVNADHPIKVTLFFIPAVRG